MRKYKLYFFNLFFWFLLFSIIFLSCERDKINGDVITDPELIEKLYTNSVDTLNFQSGRYILKTELYRDFFPGVAGKNDSPLIASIYLVNLDSLPVSADITILKLYVINDQQIWISVPGAKLQPDISAYKIDILSNKGPEWATGIFVDVILEIENSLTMDEYFIIAKHREIVRIE